MFNNAESFNNPLNNWDTSDVANMESMFENALSFNQPINNWEIYSVMYADYMFNGAKSLDKEMYYGIILIN